MTCPDAPLLVVGAGGLLGSAIVRSRQRAGRSVLRAAVPWTEPAAAAAAVLRMVAQVRDEAGGRPWQLAWCAGAGVTATGAATLEGELSLVGDIVDGLLRIGDLGEGRVFVASSAGGLYAGAADPPFTEATAPAPISAYGRTKLAVEEQFSALATGSGCRVLIGRLSNLYGPGQNLAKAQGLISQLCRSHVTGQPCGVYVSLDTVRDYLFVDDAAGLVSDGLDRLDEVLEPGRTMTKILAAQRSASIAALVGEARRIFRKRPPVLLASSPHASGQARDLRFRSVVWPALDARPLTPLPVGMDATARDVAAHLTSGMLARAGVAQATVPNGTPSTRNSQTPAA